MRCTISPRFSSGVMAVVLLCLLFGGSSAADDKADDRASFRDVLESKGLKKFGRNYVLPAEKEMSTLLKGVRHLKKSVLDATKATANAQQRLDDLKKQRVEMLRQRVGRSDYLQRNGNLSVKRRNKIVDEINALATQIDLANEGQVVLTKEADEARANLVKARQAYVEVILKARKIVDQLEQTYAKLATDMEVAAALAAMNKGESRPLKLGPSSSMTRNVRQLVKLEKTVLSETVQLRKGGSATYFVPVTFNDEFHQELVVDTGASLIALPWSMAKDIEMIPNSRDPKVRLTLADGSVVVARLMFAKKVRVGKFEVENVQCAVFPESLSNAPALLGMSYLGNFSFQLNSADGTLSLVRIEKKGR